ncbi:hypothetical protein PG993_006855 [Apiospora rasikravindrae]|uniref:Uncharacterized protein n=1 Tax=Apiospora rasikravindrae TaxID=990691 RepID=A0ABR1SVT8_9PEZI
MESLLKDLTFDEKHTRVTRETILPLMDSRALQEVGANEINDVDREGIPQHKSPKPEPPQQRGSYKAEQAAESAARGSNYTNGLPIRPCLHLDFAEPTGKHHNSDSGLLYYHSKLFPAYDDKDGFLAHQIPAALHLVCRLTGNAIAQLNGRNRGPAPKVNEKVFRVMQTTGAIMGDTMGKTYTILLVLEYMAEKGFFVEKVDKKDDGKAGGKAGGKAYNFPCLLVCTDSGVAYQWLDKIQSFFTRINPVLAFGDDKHASRPGATANVKRLSLDHPEDNMP